MKWAERAVDEFNVTSIQMESLTALNGYTADDGQPLVGALLQLYLEISPKEMAKLGLAVREGNVLRMNAITHGLKSTSAGVGALNFADLCEKIEQLTDTEISPTLVDFTEDFARLGRDFVKVQRDLNVVLHLVQDKPVPGGL